MRNALATVQVLEYDPGCSEALVAKAKVYKSVGKKCEALNLLSTAREQNPTNRDITRAIARFFTLYHVLIS